MTHSKLAKALKFDDTQCGLQECKLVNNLVISIKITFDHVISLLETYCKHILAQAHKDMCVRIFTTALSTVTKSWKPPKCPSAEN